MTKKILIIAIMIIAFIAILQCNVFATETLPEAVNGVITLTEDIELTSTYKVNETLTIDLAGHTISGKSDVSKNYELIYVGSKGNLTIKDTVGNGKITFEYTGESGEWGYYSNTISSNGILTLESGTIENTTNVEDHIFMAIDNNSNGVPAVLNINGGRVECANYIAIRQFANTSKYVNEVNVTNGTITGGKRGIWMQSPNSEQNKGSINITGGTVSLVYITTVSSNNCSLSISGEANVDDIVLSSSNTTVPEINITGGSFGFDVSQYVNEDCDVLAKNDRYIVCNHSKGETVSEIPATYKEAGMKSHWICSKCSKIFTDSERTTEVHDTDSLVIPVLAEVSENNADISENAFDKSIEESINSNSLTVVIPTVETEQTVTSVTMPVSSMIEVAELNKYLTIETSEVTVTLDTIAIEKVIERAGVAENVKIEIKKVEDTVLNEEQKEAIKDKEVALVITAELIANGQKISNFGEGKVTVEIPFTPEEGTKGTDYKVIYIADNGEITEIATKYIKGALVVELEHFSEYAVIKVANKDNNAEDEDLVDKTEENSGIEDENSVSLKTEDNTIVQTGDNIVLYIVILIISVLGVIVIAKRKFNKR